MYFVLPELPDDPEQLDLFIRRQEERRKNLKPDAEARIVWNNPTTQQKTPFALVYLHGFSASQGEGYPVHRDFARQYGLNLYLSRLAGHGVEDPDAFTGLTPQALVDSAARSIAVGRKIGRKVIVMGTSTGASLALYAASRINEDFLHGLILYSPLVDFHGGSSLLASRWGRSVLRIVPGKRHEIRSGIGHPDEAAVWYNRYRLEGALALGELIEKTMRARTFRAITRPVFVGYYYKNRFKRDKVVSVSAIRNMFGQLATPPDQKKLVNFPGAHTHVICSSILSKSVNSVKERTFRFSDSILGLKQI